MIYYNGFNLLVDVTVGLTVWFFTYRTAWWDGYKGGVEDSFNQPDVTFEERCREITNRQRRDIGMEITDWQKKKKRESNG